MKKHLWYLLFLLLTLILISGYFVLIYLQSGTNIFLGIVILWVFLFPLISSFPYSFSYFLSLPGLVYGAWLLVWMLMEKYVGFSFYVMISAFAFSFLIVFTFHVLTRSRAMFWKITMASLSRTSVAVASTMFLGLGMMLINPTAFKLEMAYEIFLFSVVLLGYVGSSMLYLNTSYRLFVLSNRLDVLHFENELARNWEKIEKKNPNQRRDLDLLKFYFGESFRCFLEGDFESSFIWGYKVIREKTLVDPIEYIDDKRVNKPSFGDIRNTLMHSRREGHIEARKIRQIRKNLFNDCLDLLDREYAFIKNVTESSIGEPR